MDPASPPPQVPAPPAPTAPGAAPPPTPPLAPRWVTAALTATVLLNLADFGRAFLRPLASEALRQTWWNLGSTCSMTAFTLGLWGLVAWRRHLGWVLAACGATVSTLLWVEHTVTWWDRPWEPTSRELAFSGVQILAESFIAVGVLLARRTAASWLAVSTAALVAVQLLAAMVILTLSAAWVGLGPQALPVLREPMDLAMVLFRGLRALPSLAMGGLLWSALRPQALRRPARRPGAGLLGVGIAGALVLAAALCHQLLQAHYQRSAPWSALSLLANVLVVLIQVAGAGLLAAGLVGLAAVERPRLGLVAAMVVGAGAGLVPLARLLLGDSDAAGFTPLQTLPLLALAVVVGLTRHQTPRATAWTALTFLCLALPFAALSTDGLTSVLHGLDAADATGAGGGVLLSVRSFVLVSAYSFLALHLAQLRGPLLPIRAADPPPDPAPETRGSPARDPLPPPA